MKKVTLANPGRYQGAVADLPEGSTVLDAALQAGIPYPHSCRGGRCGACKSRLIEGSVEHLPSLRFTLTEEEKRADYFLACRARALSDITAAWLREQDGTTPPHSFSAFVARSETLTHDIRRLELELERPAVFRPGQYAQLRIGGCAARSFSMANQPGSRRLVFYIRRVEGGCASRAVERLRPGDVVTGTGPHGDAFLHGAHSGPILAVAGGSGLAPIQSIVEGALAAGFRQPIHLYFGARSGRDLYLLSHFLTLEQQYANLRFVPVIDDGTGSSLVRRGRIADALAADWPTFAGNWQTYLAGPPPMVEALSRLVTERGVAPDQVYSDPFLTTGELAADDRPPVQHQEAQS